MVSPVDRSTVWPVSGTAREDEQTAKEREEISAITARLVTERTTDGEKDAILHELQKIPAEEREGIATQALRLITPIVDGSERVAILSSLAAIRLEERNAAVDQTLRLISPQFDGSERREILEKVRILPPGIREDVVDQSLRLFTPQISAYEIGCILNTITNIRQEERVGIVNQVLQLVSHEVDGYERNSVLEHLIRIPFEKRESTVNLVLRLINPSMHGWIRSNILEELLDYPFKYRQGIVGTALRFIRDETTDLERLEIVKQVANTIACHVHRIVTASPVSHDFSQNDFEALFQIVSELPPEERGGVSDQMLRLTEVIQTPKGCFAFLREISLFSPQLRGEAVTQTLRCLNNLRIGIDRYRNQHLILKSLRSIPPEEWSLAVTQALRLIDPRDAAVAIANTLQTLIRVTQNEREMAVELTLRLIDHPATVYRFSILERILLIPSAEREAAANQILGYVAPATDPSIRHSLAIKLLCLNERDLIINQAIRLTGNHIDERFRPFLLNELISIPEEEREEAITQTLRAVCPETDLQDRSVILRDLHLLPFTQREAAVTQTLRFVNNQTPVESRFRIVHRILSLPIDQIETVVAIGHRFINRQTQAEERVRILDRIVDTPPSHRRNMANPLEPFYFTHQFIPFDNHEMITLSLQDIAEHPIEVLNAYANTWARAIPLIQYDRSQGVDAGGITRDFLTRLFEALYSTDRLRSRLWSIQDPQALPIPRTGPARSDRNRFHKIGIVFGEILSGRLQATIGERFSPTLFAMIHSLTEHEVEGIEIGQNIQMDQETVARLIRIYATAQFPFMTAQEIQEMTDGELPERFETDEIHTLEQFFTDHGFYHMVEAAVLIAQGISTRINDWDEIKGETPAALMQAIQGAITPERIMASLVWSNPNGHRQDFLNRWIREATPDQLKKFLFSISGSETLGRRALTVFSYTSQNPLTLPSFHTCNLQIDLPQYENYEQFKERFEYSLTHAVCGLGFQYE